MITIRRALAVAARGLLATAPEARTDSPGELAERLRKATAVLSGMASGKQDTDSRDVLLGGRYAVPAGGRPFVTVLTTYSPPPKKR
jgi:hypothetical protein